MKNFFLLFGLLFLTSCSSSLKVSPGRCGGFVKLKQNSDMVRGKTKLTIREYGFGQKEVKLDEILKDMKAPECNRIEAISLSIESDFWDQVVSIIPLVSQWSVELSWDEAKIVK